MVTISLLNRQGGVLGAVRTNRIIQNESGSPMKSQSNGFTGDPDMYASLIAECADPSFPTIR
jgi:hypothetical protein